MGDTRETGEHTLGREVKTLRHPGEVPCQAVMTSENSFGFSFRSGGETEGGIGVWADKDVGR